MPNMAQLISTALALFLVSFGAISYFAIGRRQTCRRRKHSVTIIVLGDIARSPRMMYHAQSFLQHGWDVSLVGFGPTRLPNEMYKAKVSYLTATLAFASGLPRAAFLVLAPFKVALGAAKLVLVLVRQPPSQFLLVQNPPALPTLLIAQIISLLDGSSLVIDWHNTGSSILGMRLGHGHVITRLADRLEGRLGKNAYAHLFVSHVMQKQLTARWQLIGLTKVLHDRPPQHFCRLNSEDRTKLFSRLSDYKAPENWLLAVSSTSWTADEDFSILLNALSRLQTKLRNSEGGVSLVITGKGPMKSAFERASAQRAVTEKWTAVKVQTAWLERDDYPRLLGSADFGISLHSSSSGFDLPMKVVDMFGCRLPVLALNFSALDELVVDGQNGRVFDNADDLGDLLLEILQKPAQLETWRQRIDRVKNADGREWSSWSENWDHTVLPLLR